MLIYIYILYDLCKYNELKNTKPFKTIVDCQWGEWATGQCSAKCGGGERINTRTKVVEEDHGGSCTGLPTNTERCNSESCPGKQLQWNM